jgi:hypothetical protein
MLRADTTDRIEKRGLAGCSSACFGSIRGIAVLDTSPCCGQIPPMESKSADWLGAHPRVSVPSVVSRPSPNQFGPPTEIVPGPNV